MNNKQSRLVLSLQRALACLASMASDKKQAERMSTRLRGLQKQLERALAKVNATAGHTAFATSSRTDSSMSIRQAKNELRAKHLRPIVRDGLSLLKGMPGIREALRAPKRDDSVADYLKAARRIRKFVAPHARVFIEADHEPDFLARLGAAIKMLDAVGKDPGAARARSSRAVADLKQVIADARDIIGRLDTAIAADFGRDAVVRQLWRQSKRIPPRQGRPPNKTKRKRNDADPAS